MSNRTFFAVREAVNNMTKSPRKSLKYLLFTGLIHLLIAINLIFVITSNYIFEIFATGDMSQSKVYSLLPIFWTIHQFKIVQYILLGLLILILFYINKKHLTNFLTNYREEITLISRISGNNKMKRLPLLYTGGLINFIAASFAWGVTCYLYNMFSRTGHFVQLSLLSINDFRFSLLFFLLLTGVGAGLVVSFSVYWFAYRR